MFLRLCMRVAQFFFTAIVVTNSCYAIAIREDALECPDYFSSGYCWGGLNYVSSSGNTTFPKYESGIDATIDKGSVGGYYVGSEAESFIANGSQLYSYLSLDSRLKSYSFASGRYDSNGDGSYYLPDSCDPLDPYYSSCTFNYWKNPSRDYQDSNVIKVTFYYDIAGLDASLVNMFFEPIPSQGQNSTIRAAQFLFGSGIYNRPDLFGIQDSGCYLCLEPTPDPTPPPTSTVPEPSSLALLTLGAVLLVRSRRTKAIL